MSRRSTKTIAIKALSLLDLQLKLAQHPSWRILEISRLKFGFKIILQRKAKEHRQHLFVAGTHSPSQEGFRQVARCLHNIFPGSSSFLNL
jgi:hypothetical protein